MKNTNGPEKHATATLGALTETPNTSRLLRLFSLKADDSAFSYPQPFIHSTPN